jgi:hypothetical protein
VGSRLQLLLKKDHFHNYPLHHDFKVDNVSEFSLGIKDKKPLPTLRTTYPTLDTIPIFAGTI